MDIYLLKNFAQGNIGEVTVLVANIDIAESAAAKRLIAVLFKHIRHLLLNG